MQLFIVVTGTWRRGEAALNTTGDYAYSPKSNEAKRKIHDTHFQWSRTVEQVNNTGKVDGRLAVDLKHLITEIPHQNPRNRTKTRLNPSIQ